MYGPFLYNLFAIVLAALAFSLFGLPAYRYLIGPDYLRIAVCMISAGVFSAPEVVGTITNSQWFLTIGALVLLFYPVPEEWAGSTKFQLITGIAGLIVACTSPQILILLPFVLWRLYPFQLKRSIGPLLVIAGMAIQTVVLLSPHSSPNINTKSLLQTISVVVASPLYRCVLGDVIGDQGASTLAVRLSAATSIGAILLFLLWLVWLFRRCAGPARWSVVISAYAMFASIAIVALRRSYGHGYDLTLHWKSWGDGRYTLLGSVLIVYLAALTLDRIVGRRGVVASALCLLGLFSYGLQDHYSVPRFADLNWPKQAGQIESWISAADVRGIPNGLVTQLNPTPHWRMYLPARLSAATPKSPFEGCIVRGRGVFRVTDGVYLIKDGRRAPVGPDWFKIRSLRWMEDVRWVQQATLDAIPDAR